jgi:hypothetical protein
MRTTHRIQLLCALGACALAAPLASARAGRATSSRPAAQTGQAVTVAMSGKGMTVAGPTLWRPGAVRIAAVGRGGERELTLLRFRPGYSYSRFLADGARANGRSSAAAAALHRVFAETEFLGGADVFPGEPASFTVTLARGTYYLGEMSSRPVFRRIVVSGAPLPRAPQATTVVTAYDFGFRTSGQTLPAHGTIEIRNAGKQVHRLLFQTVRAGTTRTEVGAWLRTVGGRPYGPPPPFARKGPQLGTAMISPGREIELTYSLPPGEYALLCFQPDSRTGKPQALEGMYGVATLGQPVTP